MKIYTEIIYIYIYIYINTLRYNYNFARMESDCVFKVGFSSFMKSIL